MNGFNDTVNGFSLAAIQALQTEANSIYTDDINAGWEEMPLPDTPFDVTDYGLVGDGVADDTDALNTLANNTGVTNWYFPAGTFRLYKVSVPAHVVAVYGVGTLETITIDESSPFGCIAQNIAHDGYVIDGLTFVDDGGDFSSNNSGANGFIGILGNVDVSNVEIRNCTIDGTNSAMWTYPRDGLGIHGNADTGHTKNIWVHDNDFINIKGAGMELLHRGTVDTEGVNEGLYNTRVSSNTMDGGGIGWCAISCSQVRSITTIDNNTMTNWDWDFEVNQSKNVTVRNNHCSGTLSEFVSNGGSGWHTVEYNDINSPNINWVHNNHFESETAFIYMYGGSSTDYYENYINGGISIDGRSAKESGGAIIPDTANGDGGRVFNNTIIATGNIIGGTGLYMYCENVVSYEDGFTFADSDIQYYDNEVYFIGSRTTTPIALSGTCGSGVSITGNTINNTFSTDCITTGTGATISGNTCNNNYVGDIPTSRPGAGVQ